MEKPFKGRSTELHALDHKYRQQGFVMTVLYGRRRIGKTRLIHQFMKEHPCRSISFTAVEREERELLSLMSETVLEALAPELAEKISFDSFEKLFDFIGMRAAKERIIFSIDEYPYLAKQCPYIQSVLQKVIDTKWQNTSLFLILCGSLVGFMRDEVLGGAAPLHGRADLELRLRPFNYLETAMFLEGFTCEEKAICYGLTNGVAKYIEQFDTGCNLDDNIIQQFYSIGGYFTEEQIKTVITGEKKNPSMYNSIISAVATGHTKNSEIASFTGSDDVSYPLRVLVGAELLEKRMSRKPYYVLNDSMLEFWFRYVNRAASLIEAGRGEAYYLTRVKPCLHDFMGRIFEKMAKEYLLMHAGIDGIPLISEISDYQATTADDNGQPQQIEIDLAGRCEGKIILAGECKFRNAPFDRGDLNKFLDKIRFLPATDPWLGIFALGGFTEDVRKDPGKCHLIAIDDMYPS